MQVHTNLPTHSLNLNIALAVGTFDGVHRGHQLLVENVKREAAAHGLQSAVLTFQDMPYCFFKPDACPRLLTLMEEKIEAFGATGIDRLFIVPFDAQIARQPYEEFVRRTLCEKLGVKLLLCGPDFALGKDRTGDVTALRELGTTAGYGMHVLSAKLLEGDKPISSTRARAAVEEGDMQAATAMLGHVFTFAGSRVEGKKLGRTIGVPTINLRTHPRKVLPANGIYAARVNFEDGSTHKAALSIGTNPTTDASDSIKIEFHVLDENIAVPPQEVQVQVVARLRDEEKFDSLESLVQQMQRDLDNAREILT